MGCGASKTGLNHVDDSVHVMLKHDRKVQQRKGQPAHGYKERSPHALLVPKTVGDNPAPSAPETKHSGGYKERAPHPLLKPKEVGSDPSPPTGDSTGSESVPNGVVATEE
mmetsp:Transcript_31442/g.73996  ORF Transcript_31442/g.73996 Transcript_31442/m.73996 type:complete len:110 (-) Transcript_31442:594-923(-)